MDVLELLLNSAPQKLPEGSFKIKRLSRECGGDVIFKLRALPFSRVAEIRSGSEDDINVHIVLAGVTSPDLKNRELNEKYGAATPAELIKAMLLPGEIDDLAMRVERLSGYKTVVTEEIKKK